MADTKWQYDEKKENTEHTNNNGRDDKIQAIILCGGEGKRLRPLTNVTPKPLLRVGRITVIERILKNLSTEGTKNCALTLGYKAEDFISFLGSEKYGVNIEYYREDKPLGSAGGIKAAEDKLSDVFLLLCGDAYFDFKLNDAVNFLNEKNADCVIVTAKSRSPLEFGVVCTDNDSRVKEFVEKPSWSGVRSQNVNTGIYVLRKNITKLIKSGEKCDFAKDIFPVMLENNMKIYAFEAIGQWRDIGNPRAYYDCNMLETGNRSVIGRACNIHSSCIISESVIGDNVRIASGCIASGCVVGGGCDIGENVKLQRHSVIGNSATLGNGCVIGKGVIIPCGCNVKPFAVIDNPLYDCDFFAVRKASFTGECREKLSRLGAAIVGALENGGEISVAYERGSSSLRSRSMNFTDGMLRSGGNVYYIGGCSYSEARLSAINEKYDLTAFMRYSRTGVDIHFFDKNGVYPGARFESSVRYAAAFSQYPKETIAKRPIVPRKNVFDEFVLALQNEITADISNFRVCLMSGENHPFSAFLEKNGILSCEDGADMLVSLEDEGARILFDGYSFDSDHVKAVCLLELLRRGQNEILLPYRAPFALRDMALSSGASISLFSLSPYDEKEWHKAEKFKNMIPLYDGAFAAAAFINYVAALSLSGFALYSLLPLFSSEMSEAFLPDELKTAFLKNRENDGEGFILRSRRGKIRIIPENGARVALLSEAGDISDASQLINAAKKYVDDYTERNTRKRSEK